MRTALRALGFIATLIGAAAFLTAWLKSPGPVQIGSAIILGSCLISAAILAAFDKVTVLKVFINQGEGGRT